MTFGELFVVLFITAAVLSASWWAVLGEKVWGLWAQRPSDGKQGSDSVE